MSMRITAIGGPTVLLEMAGLRLLTDPTFDPAGSLYKTPVYTLRKLAGPAVPADALGDIDAVLLSHDHHFDNLDRLGRDVCRRARSILTTVDGATRVGHGATGLAPWDVHELVGADGRRIRVTATPARHGPADGDRGPVIGFVLEADAVPGEAIYISGDTVWFEGVAEVVRRFDITAAILFMGAARVPEVGPAHLTFTANEGVEVARALGDATIVPVHVDGWAHFSESRDDIARAFRAAGLHDRLQPIEPGQMLELSATR